MMRYLICFVLLFFILTTCARRGSKANRTLEKDPDSSYSSEVSLGADEVLKEKPLRSPTRSPVSLLKKNSDGSLLIKIKPQVYMSEMGCEIVMDVMGNQFAQMHYVIDFYIQEKYYYTIWGLLFGRRPPIYLGREKEYRFLIKPDSEKDLTGESIYFEIIKIWDGGRVVFEQDEVEEE